SDYDTLWTTYAGTWALDSINAICSANGTIAVDVGLTDLYFSTEMYWDASSGFRNRSQPKVRTGAYSSYNDGLMIEAGATSGTNITRFDLKWNGSTVLSISGSWDATAEYIMGEIWVSGSQCQFAMNTVWSATYGSLSDPTGRTYVGLWGSRFSTNAAFRYTKIYTLDGELLNEI
ncbi:MAG: hypothetical protein JRC86_09675, partial [Deltaproteobacteria bacterium]|nr:hypothetical protein [Deltaproteobacteria bacterium]